MQRVGSDDEASVYQDHLPGTVLWSCMTITPDYFRKVLAWYVQEIVLALHSYKYTLAWGLLSLTPYLKSLQVLAH